MIINNKLMSDVEYTTLIIVSMVTLLIVIIITPKNLSTSSIGVLSSIIFLTYVKPRCILQIDR